MIRLCMHDVDQVFDNYRSPKFTKVLIKLGFREIPYKLIAQGSPSRWESPLHEFTLYIWNELAEIKHQRFRYRINFDISQNYDLINKLKELIVEEVITT